MHVHPSRYTFSLVLGGSAQLITNEGSLLLKKGQLVMIPPNMAHQTLVEDHFVYKLIRVPVSFTDQLLNIEKSKIVFFEGHPSYIEDFENWYNCVQNKKEQGNAKALNEIGIPKVFKQYLSPRQNDQHQSNVILKKTVDYFNVHFHRPIDTKELSDITLMSKSHFHRVFKTKMGIAPMQYLLNLRIEKAKEMIKKQSNFTDIAYSTGFYDQSHFNRYFKINVGMIPKKYSDFINK